MPRELESRSVGPGDMKSLIVEEMSILWSAIGRKVLKRLQEDTYFCVNTSLLKICFLLTYVYACFGGGVNMNAVPVEA